MSTATIMDSIGDIIDRPIRAGDFVAFYSNVYQVKSIRPSGNYGKGYAKIMLLDPSKTSKPVEKYSRDMCLIPAEDVTLWLLKKDH